MFCTACAPWSPGLLLRPGAGLSWASPVFVDDVVIRTLDGETVKLQGAGTCRLYGVVTQKYGLPPCIEFAPGSRTRAALPPKRRVRVRQVKPHVVEIQLASEGAPSLNLDLVRQGSARRRLSDKADSAYDAALDQAERTAREAHAGLWSNCADGDAPGPTKKGGGILAVAPTAAFDDIDAAPPPPVPPTRQFKVKTCADFAFYEDALAYFDRYAQVDDRVRPRLDRDGDGVPCQALPHVRDKARFVFKRPTNTSSST